MHTIAALLQDVQAWTLALSGSPWIYLFVGLFCAVDGFFPPVPSESVVIALTVAAWSGDGPNLVLLALVAGAGAWCGDQVAYQLGRSVGTERVLRSARGRRAVELARRSLARRGATFILAARYVPVGRVAVNMSAGAVRYPRRRFMAVSGLAAVTWAGFALGVGVLSASWLGSRPLLAMAVGTLLGIVLGVVVDLVVARATGRHGAGRTARDASNSPGGRAVLLTLRATVADSSGDPYS